MTTHRIVTGGFFVECPDCGGTRYAAGVDVNRYGVGFSLFDCGKCGEDGALASIDIDLEADETWEVRPDETGRPALYVVTWEELDDDDADDLPDADTVESLGLDSTGRDGFTPVTWADIRMLSGNDD